MDELCSLFKEYKTIAVVGISHNRNRPSRDIAEYLLRNGFRVVGVNPAIKKAGDIDVYPNLREIPFEVDIVNVFRKPENVTEIIPDVLAVKPKVFWLQLGIVNNEAIKAAKNAGIIAIQNKCILVEHQHCISRS